MVSTLAVAPGPCPAPKLQGKPRANFLHLRWGEWLRVTIVETYTALLTIVPTIVLSYVICTSNVQIDSFVITITVGLPTIRYPSTHETDEIRGNRKSHKLPYYIDITLLKQSCFIPADRPDYDGGAAIQEYEVLMTNPDNTTRNVYAGRDQECAVAGLLPGRPYLFQVRPTNKAGVSKTHIWNFYNEILYNIHN